MDIFTHTLTGLALARAGAGRAAPYGTLALVMAANISDIDYAYALGGPLSYLARRGTWSHSLLGAAGLAAGVALLFWLLVRRRRPAPHLLRNLLLVCQLGAFSHWALDGASAWGIQLLYPFGETFYALDWLPAVDLWLVALLLLGLLLPILFRLISEEIGARRSESGVRWGAGLALAACVLLVAGRGALHSDAEAQLDSRLYRGRTPLRVAAFPTPLSPFQWHGIVETKGTYETVEISFLGVQRGGGAARTYYKPEDSATLKAALATRTATVFMARARFPHLMVIPQPQGWQVRIQDIQYASDASALRRRIAWIELDESNQVLSEGLR